MIEVRIGSGDAPSDARGFFDSMIVLVFLLCRPPSSVSLTIDSDTFSILDMGLNILLVNDDGPIDPTSPHVFPLYQTLLARGHSVTVCLPSSQKSWGSMAFTVKGEIAVWWYYPRNDGSGGRWVADEKERGVREGEAAEWVLVDGVSTDLR